MAEPKYVGGNIIATCPDCNAVSSFVTTSSDNKQEQLGSVLLHTPHQYQGTNYDILMWLFVRCVNCHRAALQNSILEAMRSILGKWNSFFRKQSNKRNCRLMCPKTLSKSFERRNWTHAFGAYRSGSALLRSVLEKALNTNGYEEVTFLISRGSDQVSSPSYRSGSR
jgi:hypothetical protein